MNTVFPCTKKGAIIWGKAIIQGRWLLQILLTEVMSLIFCFITPLKIITFGLFKCSKFGLLHNFQCQYPRPQSLNCDSDQFCYIRLNFNLAGRQEGGVDGRLFERGNSFKYFHLKGMITWGRWFIEGQLLFKGMRYLCQPSLKLILML